jgi:hypothetical protein
MSLQAYTAYIDMQAQQYLDQIPLLEVPPLPPKRRYAQPKFKIMYESRDDLWARLGGTYIWVGQQVFHVDDAREHKSEIWLIVSGAGGKYFKVPYKATEHLDLRSPDPQYVNIGTGPVFLTRKPDRQFLQGMTRSNLFTKRIGKTRFHRLEDGRELVPALSDTESLVWQSSYSELMKTRALQQLRLSPCIAFYRNQFGLAAEYRGRPLGYVTENCVSLDDNDFDKPWIRQDLHEIGCTTRKGGDVPAPEAENQYD